MNDDINLKTKDWDNYYVLIDFDRTLTDGNSTSSWEILSKGGFMPEEYVLEVNKLYEYYRPFEVDLNISNEEKNKLMREWWSRNIELFSLYGLKEKVISKVVKCRDFIYFRSGASKFLELMHDKNIPVIIMSAGIGNVIEEFLKQEKSLYDNIYIVSNFIKFNNGVAFGIENNIIHSLNKNESFLPIDVQDRNVILMGDVLDDVYMVDDSKREDALKIGFLNKETMKYKKEFLKVFDVVMDFNEDFYDVMNKLDIFKNDNCKKKILK